MGHFGLLGLRAAGGRDAFSAVDNPAGRIRTEEVLTYDSQVKYGFPDEVVLEQIVHPIFCLDEKAKVQAKAEKCEETGNRAAELEELAAAKEALSASEQAKVELAVTKEEAMLSKPGTLKVGSLDTKWQVVSGTAAPASPYPIPHIIKTVKNNVTTHIGFERAEQVGVYVRLHHPYVCLASTSKWCRVVGGNAVHPPGKTALAHLAYVLGGDAGEMAPVGPGNSVYGSDLYPTAAKATLEQKYYCGDYPEPTINDYNSAGHGTQDMPWIDIKPK